MTNTRYFRNGADIYSVSFSFEDYKSGNEYDSYKDIPNDDEERGAYVGWLRSVAFGGKERIDILFLDHEPSAEELGKFERECISALGNDEELTREQTLELIYAL